MFRKAREVFTLASVGDYQYEPLPNARCVRLLQIEPAVQSAMIRCSLRIVDLDDHPSFVALSYSWKKDIAFEDVFRQLEIGLRFRILYYKCKWRVMSLVKDQMRPEDVINKKQMSKKVTALWESVKVMADEPDSKMRAIACNGRLVRIHPNLYDALLRLRNSKPGAYWIDAICINQEDIEERNAQVQLMGSIYSAATRVVVWLGVLPASLYTGIARLIDLAKPKEDETVTTNRTALDAVSSILSEPKKTELLLALAYLMTRRWFRRLWVIQECCLARERLLILGDHEFSPATLISIISYMTGLANGPLKPFLQGLCQTVPLWENLIQHIPIVLGSNKILRHGERWSLGRWLLIIKSRKCTDPRDAVFAGLSLVAPRDLRIDQHLQLESTGSVSKISTTPCPRLWHSLHADYNSEVSDVLLNLAACIITRFDWTQLFCATLWWRAIPEFDKTDGLPLYQYPSWVPDPSAWSSFSLHPYFMLENPGFPFPSDDGNVEEKPRISSDGSTLFLTGAELDTVTQWSPIKSLKTESYEALLQLVQWIAHAVPSVCNSSGYSGMQVLARVLMSSDVMKQEPASHVDDDMLLIMVCNLIATNVQCMLAKSNKRQSSLPANLNYGCPTDEQRARLIEAFNTAKEKHTYAPWPSENVDDNTNQSPESGQPNRPLPNTENSTLSQSISTGPRIETQAASVNNQSAFFAGMTLSAIPGIVHMSVFMTKRGYIGLGPTWLREGDRVFCIRGGKAPYIFTHIDEVLRRRAGEIRSQLSERAWRPLGQRTKALKVELQTVESRIGMKDGWQLVGEAYVDGVMRGEVAEEMEGRVERISIV